MTKGSSIRRQKQAILRTIKFELDTTSTDKATISYLLKMVVDDREIQVDLST